MKQFRIAISIGLCALLLAGPVSAEADVSYNVKYSGGSLPNVKGGEDLKLYVDAMQIRLHHKSQDVVDIPARAITGVSYSQEVHHRIGTAASLAVVSLGIGAIIAFSKSKKHYIGITWADSDSMFLEADKNEYRGLVAALEGVSGRRGVDSDSSKHVVQSEAVPQARAILPPPVAVSLQQAPPVQPEGTIVRFVSTPANAEVQVDGQYWGRTPTADLTRLPVGAHTILVKKVGYQPWERKITLASGDDRTISAELETQPQDPTKAHIAGN
ncbi:MAG: PEGA domain-containing protein [Bryobacteraceae bacterium]|jgi:hypothetical protein